MKIYKTAEKQVAQITSTKQKHAYTVNPILELDFITQNKMLWIQGPKSTAGDIYESLMSINSFRYGQNFSIF